MNQDSQGVMSGVALLRRFQHVVIGFAFGADLRGHAVEPLSGPFRARQRKIGNGAGNAPVAIVKRVDGDEPQVRDPGFQDGIRRRCLEPVEEARYFRIQRLFTAKGKDIHRTICGE